MTRGLELQLKPGGLSSGYTAKDCDFSLLTESINH